MYVRVLPEKNDLYKRIESERSNKSWGLRDIGFPVPKSADMKRKKEIEKQKIYI